MVIFDADLIIRIMKQEMYSNVIGKEVWYNCKNCKIWINDYYVKIEVNDNHLFDRIDIVYDSRLENGEIKGVWVIKYNSKGEEETNLSVLSLDKQKQIFEHLKKELSFIK